MLKRRVGYIVKAFPTEFGTFEMREMLAVSKKANVEIYVFSLKTPHNKTYSNYAESLLPNTFHSPFIFSFYLILAQIYFLQRKPKTYCSTLLDVLSKTWRTPTVLLKSVAIFPKSVYFAKRMEEYKINHIHSHFVHIPTTAAMIISRLTGIPFSCTGHNSDIYQYPPPDMKNRIKMATPFITISAFWKKYLTALFGKNLENQIEIVHCGIDLDEFKPTHTVRMGPIMFLTVARLEPIKGLRYLVEACYLLREKGLDFQCDIVGDGSERKDLERLVREKELESVITFHGTVLPENIIDFYQRADIFVLPSFREGIPVSAMEAMAMELSVVSTNVFGIPELVEDGVEGILVSPGNAGELANAIETLCRDRELRMVLGKNGRKKVERDFNIKKIAGRLFGLFFREESPDINQSNRCKPVVS